jgi:glycyl-tRNA synthetase beta chain
VVSVADVAAKQKTVTTDVLGPPAKVGFDDDGRPTLAAEKFAEKVGLPINRVTVKETAKGAYLCARKTERGRATRKLVGSFMPEVIQSLPFPKTMRWADYDLLFARPIHSVLCLLGEQLVSFNLGPIKSTRTTRGHYFMSPGRIKIASPDAYLAAMENARVIVDINRRREMVLAEVQRAAAAAGGQVLPDEELLDIVTQLVEFPTAVTGNFEDEFLALPQEILITAMREHQKYFAVVDSQNKLMAHFVAVNNTITEDPDLVATGHERVLRARLKDAQFFYNSDVKDTAEKRVERLKGVMFQARLGSVYDKTLRVRDLAAFIARQMQLDATAAGHLERAAMLSKSDLVSQVVGEFPKLQGVMGRVYAAVDGEPEAVSAAIEEHYRPVASGAALPANETGALLSIADKIDSMVGCFGVGLEPTGTTDPYALRRQGIGIIQIMLDRNLAFPLARVVAESARLFGAIDGFDQEQTVAGVMQFMSNRLTRILAEEGYAKDIVAAAIAVSADPVTHLRDRVRALQKLKQQPDFSALAAAFKRVVNIIKKAGADIPTAVVPERFQESAESRLHEVCEQVHVKVPELLSSGQVDAALKQVAVLKQPVDRFFEDVMVMTEDAGQRSNRLALLARVANVFAHFADFSKIST